MGADIIQIRRATPADAAALAAVHETSWRSTYQGIIPHLHLERMISRRGPDYWRHGIQRGGRVLLLAFDGRVQGYASIGRARAGGRGIEGEIFELYLTPCFQGVGLGKRLFTAARSELKRGGLRGLIVWALADNHTACAFYQRQGGRRIASAPERYGKVTLERIAFVWPARTAP